MAVRDSAGVRVLMAGSTQSHADTLRLVARPFSKKLPDFGDIRDVAMGPAGRLVVLDPTGPEVVVLDSIGAEESRFGGDGDGPGEFRAAGLTDLVVTGDTIVVPDLAAQRVTLFSMRGQVLSTVPVEVSDGLPLEWRLGPKGSLLFRRMTTPQRLETLSIGEQPRFSIFQDLKRLSLPSAAGPLMPLPVWCAFGDGRLALGRTDKYRVEILEGDVTQTMVESDAGTRPLSDADKQHLQALLTESISRRFGRTPSPEQVKGLLDRTPLPDEEPSLASVRCVGTSELWVQRALPVAEMDGEILRVGAVTGWGSPDWDVFDVRSAERRAVRMPAGTQITRVTGQAVVGFQADAYGRKVPVRWTRGPRDSP